MSNPLVDRILNNPLTFLPAKAPEKEVQTTRSPAYIVLNSSLAPATLEPAMGTKKHGKREDKRPKSMAEAIAAYTGRKYLTKAEKRRKSRPEARPVADPESSSDDKYESASEFHLESSVIGTQDASEDVGEDLGEFAGLSNGSGDEALDPDSGLESLDGDASDSTCESDDISDLPQRPGSPIEREAPESSATGAEQNTAEESAEEASDADFASDDSALESELESLLEDELAGDSDSKASGGNSDGGAGSADILNSSHNGEPDKAPGQPNGDQTQLKKDFRPQRNTHLASHYTLGETGGSAVCGRVTRAWTAPYKDTQPAGLLNFGVTCYMNSAIQIMVHIPAVQHYLAEVFQGKHAGVPAKSVTHTFAELALRMWGVGSKKGGPRKHVNPKKMVQRLDDINCMMSEWQQEDSHEYFMSLMSRLQEDSTPKGTKLNQLVLYDIFGGLLDQEVVCQECRTSSVTKQEFYDLSLGLNKKRTRSNDGIDTPADDHKLAANKYTIEKSIRDFFSTETIRVDRGDPASGYFCEKCQKRTVATKRSAIERSPHTLMVHLKRFKFNGNSSLKVKQPIHYLKFLDMGAYSQTEACIKYQLMGVIVHEGRSILSGHYVAHCLQPDGSWSTYDDEYINKIDEASALSDPSAYCLVYMKLEEKTKKRAKAVGGDSKRARTA
ncbi:cysteine proteinase [Metschnikowia bicuspidata var. bicuspidata NRRL YB-4993]|uniref:ubiquitinyl hydrolase 1 n=1 Tax=Metschnikowia bicuspidata var. bicuspidata NRRL YB-4993 TaxID=869754 RepID=A0A1A0HFA2_9ASCO|nr:cysteine proteinase [Metschnikowia bicuspidata var. bicuspidata NRRL YB-4993]OBA22572.1 cysteine proteinase [Metschnikowia bicuspidata var. bicuspidata NRRL YB-4993]